MATSDVIVVALDHNKLPLLSFGWAVLAVVFAAILAAIILGVQP